MLRRIVLIAAALTGVLVFPATVAHAQCEFDGTVPGTASKVTAISVGGQTFYIDDRDYADLDDDGVAGGIWIYYESNRVAGLQRGGNQVVLGMIPGTVPYIPPTYVVPPDEDRPVLPNGLQILPGGFGGGSVAEAAGEHDPCTDSPTPDTLLL